MLCLSCTQDSDTSPCAHCGADLGDLAQNEGYLPQLRNLENQLAQQSIHAETADAQLDLLGDALSVMILQLDRSRSQLLASLDDLQTATFNAILEPLRAALQSVQVCIQHLPLDEPWSEWPMLEAAQVKITAGYRAIQLLLEMSLQSGLQAGVESEALHKAFQDGRTQGLRPV